MDDRTTAALMGGVMIVAASARRATRAGGVMIVAASARRATRAAERSAHASFARDVQRYGHLWRRRGESLAACAGGAVGASILLYAGRRHRRVGG